MNLPVTVIIAARNEARRLASTLAALAPQGAAEVIVVDNGSTDATADIARQAGARVLLEPKRGAGAARNAGIRESRTPLIAFLDAHCLPDPGWLQALVDACKPPGVGGVQGATRHKARNPVVSWLLERAGETNLEAVLDATVRGRRDLYPWVRSGNALFRRTALEQAGLFDERIVPAAEDVDLGFRVVLSGYHLVHAPGASAEHWDDSSLFGFLVKTFRYGVGAAKVQEVYRNHGADTRFAMGRSGGWPSLFLQAVFAIGFLSRSLPVGLHLRPKLPPRSRGPATSAFRPWFVWDHDDELQIDPQALYWEVGQAMIVLNPEGGERLELNGSAASIFRGLAERQARSRVLAELAAPDEATAAEHLDGFINELLRERVLRKRAISSSRR